MNSRRRKILFWVFAVFFLVVSPFLVLLSLGYSINFRNRQVNNNLTVKIQTYPRFAKASLNNQTFDTPTELQIPVGWEAKLNIEKEEYFKETFKLYGKNGQNSVATMNDLWLLPKESEKRNSSNKGEILNILNESLLLIKNENEYFVQNYNFNGIENTFQKIEMENGLKIQSGSWKVLQNRTFWEPKQKLLLYQNPQNQWKMFNLGKYKFEIKKVVFADNRHFLALDKDTNLWLLDTQNERFTFLDKGYLDINFTTSPDAIWLLSQTKILRLDRKDFNPENQFVPSVYTDTSPVSIDYSEDQNSSQYFEVQSTFLGVAFKIGKLLIYIPDSNKSSLQIISNNAKFFGSFGSTVFWIDYNNFLGSYNFLIKDEKIMDIKPLALENEENITLSYYGPWKRLMLYTTKNAYSIWVNFELENSSILEYSTLKWLENMNCYNKIENNYQFCVQSGQLVFYKNNTFPFP